MSQICASPRPQWAQRDMGGQSDGEEQNWSDEYSQAWNMRWSLHSVSSMTMWRRGKEGMRVFMYKTCLAPWASSAGVCTHALRRHNEHGELVNHFKCVIWLVGEGLNSENGLWVIHFACLREKELPLTDWILPYKAPPALGACQPWFQTLPF